MEFLIAVDIAAPADIVWSVISDVEHWSDWTASVTSVRRLDHGPLGVGSRALIRQPRLPPALWQVTALDQGRSFTWVTRAPGLRIAGDHAVAAAPEGSRATLALHYRGLLGGVLARMTAGLTNRYLGMEAAGLKARSEALACG